MEFERDYDILVAGAGVAGIAAALTAARAGMRTALVEKTILLGGLATSGLIDVYLPLCDGHGRQVTFGIAEELLHASIRYGPGDVPSGWTDGAPTKQGRYLARFSPAAFALALDELVVEAGIELWLDTLICTPAMDGDRVVGLEVETKGGRGLLRATCIVDATGDADVAFRAGCPCGHGANWLSIWAVQARLERARQATAEGSGRPLYDGIRLGGDNAGRGAASDRCWHGTDARDVTQFVLECRKLLRDHLQAAHAEAGEAGRHNHFPLALPSMAQLRTTRRIAGQTSMAEGQQGQHVPDSIGLVADWRRAGEVWEIPYGALIPQRVRGLLVAGRCIAAEGEAWEVARVIPPAALTGQAAGLAATLAIEHDTTPERLDAADLQGRLRDAGIAVHLTDVGL
ncbi:MAG: FAD-dependent oxidoreductase [Planctomycetota bacterium]